jgi:hypothetical protein
MRYLFYLFNAQNVNYFSFDEGDAEFIGFIVLDSQTRKLFNQRKIARVLAAERMKDQIETLEKKVLALPVNKPVFIVSADCLLNYLPSVKRWVSTQSYVLVIPTAVIDRLDYVKKESKEAREATRFILEKLKFRTPYLRVQGIDEKVEGDEKFEYGKIISCFRYFESKFPKRRVELITDNSELCEMATEIGVRVSSVKQIPNDFSLEIQRANKKSDIYFVIVLRPHPLPSRYSSVYTRTLQIINARNNIPQTH